MTWHMDLIVWLKRQLYLFPQDAPLPRALNDSGCPLGNTDLFDTGLDDEEEEEEEESLDAIRAAVKHKMKKHKVQKEPFSVSVCLYINGCR